MTALDPDGTKQSGEWGLFVARAVQEIRRELGEAAASRVATSLHNQKNEAMDAARDQVDAAEAMLARSLEEVAQARRAHERLQADIARMNAALRDAKLEASRHRSEAADHAAHRKAELDALAEAEAARIAAAWEDLRQHEADLAARRAELLNDEEASVERYLALDVMAAEIEQARAEVEAERVAAQQLVDEALARTEAVQRIHEINDERAIALAAAEAEIENRAQSKAAEVIDLRDSEIDTRERMVAERITQLDERAAELDEWEADLIARAERLARRESTFAPTPPPAGDNIAGWGRRRRDDGY